MMLSFEKNMAISRLCEDILSTHKKIHSVLALNKNGRVIEYTFSSFEMISKMNKSEIEMLYMQRTLQTSLSMEFDKLIGPLNCITLERETLFEFLFPFSEGIIFVTCDLDVIPRYLSKKILFMIHDFEWRISNPIYEHA